MTNKHHKEVKQALELLAKIAEEAGQYGEAKEEELKAVDILFNFIEQRI